MCGIHNLQATRGLERQALQRVKSFPANAFSEPVPLPPILILNEPIEWFQLYFCLLEIISLARETN